MTAIHNEAREVWRRVSARHKETADPLDKEVLALLAKVMPMIPEAKKKENGLHPLHRELILGFQDTIRQERRDKSENTAFAKIVDIATPEGVALLKRFYKLPRPKEYVEFLSSRVKAVDTLMNSYVKQLEYAEAYFKAHPRAGMAAPKVEIPDAPKDWRARSIGAFQDEGFSSWAGFYRDYKPEALRILAGEDLS